MTKLISHIYKKTIKLPLILNTQREDYFESYYANEFSKKDVSIINYETDKNGAIECYVINGSHCYVDLREVTRLYRIIEHRTAKRRRRV